ncbi:UvrB/UvrC motif-containing protein [Ferdinandcohnia quinoae]|uniref:UvrB/UvrC motif-containing protein n=1 Tax=Fredinandcohnia quinoae TaxID=2918902 RepID=A0AAW5DZP5_9BACI|nr:UvrB/UvrC motif-containing protein [Fredinandcohnia sp. SECRCQ15]MCH1626131.1 UvrB/UvrC motif-containing protein [Fredinandcohnia sp. SECRCQ15]
MICQECNQRPATLHFTKIINGDKTEVHICEHCAQEKGEMFMFPGSAGFSIDNLLAGLLNIEPIKGAKPNAFQQNEVLQCESCKMTFPQFAKVGRFGCSNCYQTFEKHLNPILKRLHSGNTNHTGKIPKRIGGTIHIRKEIDQLKQKLKEYISLEEFEKAAEVRDQVRSLEKSLSGHREGEE